MDHDCVAAPSTDAASNNGFILATNENDAALSCQFPDPIEETRLMTAKAWKRANDLPGRVFGEPGLFTSPALNILLELYIAWREGLAVNVSSACFASSAPPTTALRCISRLVELGFLRKSDDPRDQRVCFLALTRKGIDDVVRLLDDVTASNRRLNIGRLGIAG